MQRFADIFISVLMNAIIKRKVHAPQGENKHAAEHCASQSHEYMEPSGHKIQENHRNRFKILAIKQLLAEQISASADILLMLPYIST